MRKTSAFICAVLFTLPIFSFAVAQEDAQSKIQSLIEQIAGLKKQIAERAVPNLVPDAPKAAPCRTFSRTLRFSSRGDDVRELQEFLIEQKLLNAEPTGYFGRLTEKALQEFQKSHNIVSSGTPNSTGWGVLGPKTRVFIATLCKPVAVAIVEPVASTTPTPVCPLASPSPNLPCNGIWQKINDTSQCHIGWRCVVTNSGRNRPPEIKNIDGPRELFPHDYVTWTIFAIDAENDKLEYSAVWGDEDPAERLNFFAGFSDPAYSTESRVSHSFANPGIRKVQIKVRDSAGNVTSATLVVEIKSRLSDEENASSTIDKPKPRKSCTTPHGNQTVADGNMMPFETYFTNGVSSGTGRTLQMLCDDGTWLQCDVLGQNCRTFRPEIIGQPNTSLESYGSAVGGPCSSDGARKNVSVSPGTLLCRGLLCAMSQNYAITSLRCQYVSWIDWGIFQRGATTSALCAEPSPCEYRFGASGIACAAKLNGQCQDAPFGGWPVQ